MSRIIHLIDRSRVEAREDCPRMRYLGYDFDQDGIEPEEQSLPLLSGIAIHAAHARLLAGSPLESVVSDIINGYVDEIKLRGLFGLDVTQQLIREQGALLEGMLRLWAVTRMPMILEEYEIEIINGKPAIELPFDWELTSGLVERLRFDAILKRRDDGLRFIIDWKSMGYPSELVMEKFEHNLQTCLYIQALKERTQEPVGGILYEGLIKGRFAKDTARNSPFYGMKIQQSPYTIAYKLDGEYGEAVYQTNYTAKKGYHKVRTFEEMSVKDWVTQYLIPGGSDMTPANELFVSVPAISPPDYELLRVKEQVIREEVQYLDWLKRYNGNPSPEFLDLVAPLRTGRCFKFGVDHRCKFTGICFNQGIEPLADGSGYRKRKPHHDTDMRMVA